MNRPGNAKRQAPVGPPGRARARLMSQECDIAATSGGPTAQHNEGGGRRFRLPCERSSPLPRIFRPPSGGCPDTGSYPRLAPWATFCRPLSGAFWPISPPRNPHRQAGTPTPRDRTRHEIPKALPFFLGWRVRMLVPHQLARRVPGYDRRAQPRRLRGGGLPPPARDRHRHRPRRTALAADRPWRRLRLVQLDSHAGGRAERGASRRSGIYATTAGRRISISSPRSSSAGFARFAREAARIHREHSDEAAFYAPVNEISFFAWAASRELMFPHAYGRRRRTEAPDGARCPGGGGSHSGS